MFALLANYYYISIALQAICAIHCIRKGNQQKWIWIIVFLPVIGCLIYIFSEIFTKTEMQQMQSGVGAVFNPTGKIKTLQDNLRFADTFNNKMLLADAYLAAGQTDKAIDLYEGSLIGNFADNEQANMQLIVAYYNKKQYEGIVRIAKKIYHLPQFKLSRAHMIYAIALGYTGNNDEAEKQFSMMKGRFSNYESRYHFGLFLKRINKEEEAYGVFKEMVDEATHLTSNEKKDNRNWFSNARIEMKAMEG